MMAGCDGRRPSIGFGSGQLNGVKKPMVVRRETEKSKRPQARLHFQARTIVQAEAAKDNIQVTFRRIKLQAGIKEM